MKRFDIENRRYTGSKAKLTNWIHETISMYCFGNTFLDLFGGTGVVSAKIPIEKYNKIVVNDFLISNYVIYNAFFGNQQVSEKKLKNHFETIQNILNNDLESNYFSTMFGKKYFTMENAIIIGEIREYIQKIKKENRVNKREFHILIASLIYSMDKVANTVGHYEAFFRNAIRTKKIEFQLIDYEKYSNNNYEIYNQDANKLVKKIKSDIVYIDPPYNSRQYSRFYHVIETLVHWDSRELFGVAMKPKPENMSEYSRGNAVNTFRDLVTNLECKFIVVSYNNTFNPRSKSSKNKMTFEQILGILKSKGETRVLTIPHKHFNSGKTKFNNHEEIIFLTEVKNEK